MTEPPIPPFEPRTTAGKRGALRPVYFVAGLVLLGVGIAGYFLPLLPGTIFLILAAACFARSSRRLENWLISHPRLGPAVVAWRRNGAIPRKAKIVAIIAMAISFAVILAAHPPQLAIWVSGAVLLACALFVGTRPGVPAGD